VTRTRMDTARAHDVMIYLPAVSMSIDPRSPIPGGGAENQMLMLAKGLSALGARVCLAAFDNSGELPPSIAGVDLVRRAPYHAKRGLLGELHEVVAIYKCIDEGDADIVIARCAVPSVAVVAWAAKLQKRQLIYSSANIFDFDIARVEPSRRTRLLVRHGIRAADQIVVQTEEQRALCEQQYGRIPTLIRSIAQPVPPRDGRPDAFLWAGRVCSYKRPLAFVELARALPEARFRMVCVPEPLEESRKLLDEVHRSADGVPNLELLGPLPRLEMAAMISRSVAVVNTSDVEGLSNVMLEGWARGVPGIALSYDPDGLLERRGLGWFAGGSRTRLASTVRTVWERRFEVDDLNERCRRHVREHHDWNKLHAQWFELLGLGRTSEQSQPTLVGAT